MLFTRVLAWPVMALSGLTLTACDVNIQNGKASFGMHSSQSTQEWTRQYALASGGRVELVNINGPIELTSGTPGTVDVHVTITAKALTEQGARDVLSRGKVQEVAEPGRIRLETIPPRGIHGSYEVHYQVQLPPESVSDVSTTNGSLKADGLQGRLKITSVNGRVEIAGGRGAIDAVATNGSFNLNLEEVTAAVSVELTNGRLTVQLPSSTKANLSARVVNGSLSVSGLPVEQPGGRRIRDLEAALNGGGPQITLRATNSRLDIQGR